MRIQTLDFGKMNKLLSAPNLTSYTRFANFQSSLVIVNIFGKLSLRNYSICHTELSQTDQRFNNYVCAVIGHGGGSVFTFEAREPHLV